MRARVAPAALALLLGTVGAPPALGAGPAPLEQARQAAEHTAFEGVLSVRWRDGDVMRSERLTVEAASGSLVVHGANEVMARPAFGRLVSHGGGGWEEMWLPSRAPAPRPDGSKYVTTAPIDGPPVAGRASRVAEIHHHGVLLERIYLDTQTDLLLQRDQFDRQGGTLRTLAFESLTVRPSAAPPAEPRSRAHHAPEAVAPERLGPSTAAPPSLADGYDRMGIYRSGPALQILYSDGVYDLSVFQQPGRLRRSDLPRSGDRVAVGGATGWRYPWPGGQLIVWSAGGKVFTAVSDAPAEQVLAAARSLPPTPTRDSSLLDKMRRACAVLMEPLA
ncbi:MAG: hypothetical protein ACR2KK_19075 [Acidimicrobiales bacterium]